MTNTIGKNIEVLIACAIDTSQYIRFDESRRCYQRRIYAWLTNTGILIRCVLKIRTLDASQCHSVRESTSKCDILSRTERYGNVGNFTRYESSHRPIRTRRIVRIVQKYVRDWINYECIDKMATYRNIYVY